MKKQNILLIVLAVLVIAGGVWFFTRDEVDKADNDAALVDGSDETDKTPQESEEGIVEKNDVEENDGDSQPEEITDTEESAEGSKQPRAEIEVGKAAPDFNLKSLSGENVSLSDYEGKIVLLNFWATWCGFCVKEMPDLDKFDKEHEEVVVLAVDVMEEEGKVREYIEEGGYDFDVALDLDGQISRDYLVSAYPTSYFIETDGTLIGRVAGLLEYDQMLEILDSIKSDR